MLSSKLDGRAKLRLAIASLSAMTLVGLTFSCARSQSVAIAPQLSSDRTSAEDTLDSPNSHNSAELISQKNGQAIYNPATAPQFQPSSQLQAIVDEIVADIERQKLPTAPLSITLIDVKTRGIAGFQSDSLRYPASVVKLFWMVALYGNIAAGNIDNTSQIQTYLNSTIKHSDNDAAASILDIITDTRSQKKLPADRLAVWLQKRQTVNKFFELAGYTNININQKTFPVSSIGMTSPQGTDLQMRGNPRNPMRNKITTNHAARLMYEIFQGYAISSDASQKMQSLLTRNLDPQVWKSPKNYPIFNPVRGFLGQGLVDKEVRFASKAGWTSSTRGEAAYISANDGQTAYIIAIIGDDRAYASNAQLFPRISRFVYDRLTKLE